MCIFSKKKEQKSNHICLIRKYLPKYIQKHLEKKHFAERYKNGNEWLLVDETIFDNYVKQDGSAVWVVIYAGKSMKNAGVIGNMLGHKPCNSDCVIWSKKTIELTTEAMWEDHKFELREPKKT